MDAVLPFLIYDWSSFVVLLACYMQSYWQLELLHAYTMTIFDTKRRPVVSRSLQFCSSPTNIRVQYKVHTVHVQCLLKCKQSAIMYLICEDNFKHISPQ